MFFQIKTDPEYVFFSKKLDKIKALELELFFLNRDRFPRGLKIKLSFNQKNALISLKLFKNNY